MTVLQCNATLLLLNQDKQDEGNMSFMRIQSMKNHIARLSPVESVNSSVISDCFQYF